ncbi:EAL domain-containing protein [Thiovibrio sp. JS02]
MPTFSKWKATLTVLATILCLAGGFLFWGITSRQGDLRQQLRTEEAHTRELLSLITDQAFGHYRFRLKNLLSTRPELVDAFARRDRDGLLALARPLFEKVFSEENPALVQFQFYTPDDRLFMQAQQPRAPLAEVGAARPMVTEANRRRVPMAGYDLCRDGLFYRIIQPVFHGGEYLGAVEFGLQIERLVEKVGKGHDHAVEMSLLFAKEAWKDRVLSVNHPIRELDDRVLFLCCRNIFERLPADFHFGADILPKKIDGRWYVFDTTLVLRDFRDEGVARVALALEVSRFVEEFREFVLLTVFLAVAAAVVAFLILHFSFAAMHRELYAANRSLEANAVELNKNYAELSRYRHHLEEIIVERTVDLAKINEDLNQEILERVRVENDLRRKEHSLAKAQALARLGHFEWDVLRGNLACSEEACRIFGVGTEDLACGYDGFLRHVHPEDLAMVREWLKAALAGEAMASMECRIARPDGQVRYVHTEVEQKRDQGGRVVQLTGVVQDVSEARFANQQLILSDNVFENSIEGIVITDAQGAIQRVNPAFTAITGYQAREALGENPRILKSDRHADDFFAGMWKALVEKGQWQGEIWNRRKDGEVYPQWLTITSIRDGQGNVVNYVGVFHDMTEVKLHEEQLRHQAHHDALTGLPNRLLFHDRLGVAMAHARREASKVAVLFLDLDNFKRINDSLGHTVGDLLLKEVAARLARCVREGDSVARYGGDEFIVLLEGVPQHGDAILAAQRIIEGLAPVIRLQDQEFHLTVSLGIAFYPEDGQDQEALIKNADTAMYRAKEKGKNTYQVFTPAMTKRLTEWLAVENSLRKALARGEFVLHYQPKVDLLSGQVVGVEALVRWAHRNGDLVGPADFIPMAEDTGLIIEIGDWVLRQACEDLQKIRAAGYGLKMSVNLSPRQFRQEDVCVKVRRIIAGVGIEPGALIFEITEGTVMENERKAVALLNELKEMGCGISIDDFGTGYSSLYYLKQLPIGELKIDRKFVKDIMQHGDDMAIVTAIISMAKSLKLLVVAEGVETMDQLVFLRRLGCDQMQGFLVSRPLPREELLALLASDQRLAVFQRASQHPLPFGAKEATAG